ncbi:MAG: SRPBCC family protein [Ilumatobacter sp.]|uniref:SRPBCC family protein n=1 Tax=Ilumatobacter sp. TaxID=1967498 RepID=UPI00329755D3
MATVERRATIEATRRDVWSVLSDFGAISAWAPNVDHSCLLSEQVEGVGTTRRIQTDRSTIVETVREWEADSMLSYSITGLPPVIRSVVNTWRLEADADATRVTLTTEVDAGPRPPQQIVARLVGKRFASASDQMIAGLTRHLEQRQQVAA